MLGEHRPLAAARLFALPHGLSLPTIAIVLLFTFSMVAIIRLQTTSSRYASQAANPRLAPRFHFPPRSPRVRPPPIPAIKVIPSDPPSDLSEDDTVDPPDPLETKSLALQCLEKNGLSPNAWRDLDEVPIHIVYFIWLPDDKNGRGIVEAQFRELEESRLLDRKEVYLHIAMQTKSETEREWFNEYFAPIKEFYGIRMELFVDDHNYYEFIGIRWLHMLACKNPDAIMLYFHNKGARYAHGRRVQESFLTTQTITHWRDILALMIQLKDYSYFNVPGGNSQWVWYNFYWVWAQWFQTSPRPRLDLHRHYYENYSGMTDLKARCQNLTSLEDAVKEKPVKTNYPDWHYKKPSYYNFVYCDAGRYDRPETLDILKLISDPDYSRLQHDTSPEFFADSVRNYTLKFHANLLAPKSAPKSSPKTTKKSPS